MSDFERDPLVLAVSEAEAAQRAQAAQDERVREHARDLLNAAQERGVAVDDSTEYTLAVVALHLGAADMITDPAEQHARDRGILIDLIATGVDQPVIGTIMAYRAMEPLTEVEAGLVTEKMAEAAVRAERMGPIYGELDALLEAVGVEPTQDIAAFLNALSTSCYELRYGTDPAEVEVRRANFIEKNWDIVDKAGLDARLRRVIASFLKARED
jgi:hypothetical protein